MPLIWINPIPDRPRMEGFFKKVVKSAFSHRRKTILNSLKGSLNMFGNEDIAGALEKCSIDSGRRAETLGMEDFPEPCFSPDGPK